MYEVKGSNGKLVILTTRLSRVEHGQSMPGLDEIEGEEEIGGHADTV
jgi:hypothetical protein